MLQTVVVPIRSAVTYVAILVYIAVAAPLALVAGAVFRWKGGMYLLGHGGVLLSIRSADQPHHRRPNAKKAPDRSGASSVSRG